MVTGNKEFHKKSAEDEAEDDDELDWGQDIEPHEEAEGPGVAALTPYRYLFLLGASTCIYA